ERNFSIRYFVVLPLSSKQLLLANDIKFPTLAFVHRPTFNYISLCAFPYTFYRIIEMVLGKEYKKIQMKAKRNLLEQEIYIVSQCKKYQKIILENCSTF